MSDRAIINLSEGQKIINLPFSYMPGNSSLLVSINGKVLSLNSEYNEIGISKIKLNDPAKAGEVLEARILSIE